MTIYYNIENEKPKEIITMVTLITIILGKGKGWGSGRR
jgi:hypothetical protein